MSDRDLNDARPTPEKMGFEGKTAQAQASVGEDLWELHAAAAKVAEFTDGRSFTDFEQSEVLRALVQSMLGIMHEALVRIEKAAPAQAGKLRCPELKALAERMATRPVADSHLWLFVQESLPELLGRAAEELAAWHEG